MSCWYENAICRTEKPNLFFYIKFIPKFKFFLVAFCCAFYVRCKAVTPPSSSSIAQSQPRCVCPIAERVCAAHPQHIMEVARNAACKPMYHVNFPPKVMCVSSEWWAPGSCCAHRRTMHSCCMFIVQQRTWQTAQAEIHLAYYFTYPTGISFNSYLHQFIGATCSSSDARSTLANTRTQNEFIRTTGAEEQTHWTFDLRKNLSI